MNTFAIRGINIQMKLKERKRKGLPSTQRWLLSELRKIAFSTLSEYKLSNILNGYTQTEYGDAVLTAAEKILAEDDHEHAKRVS